MTSRRRRQYGSGSVYRRASDGRYCATIEAGYTRTGGRKRITITGKTEADVKAKLKAKQVEIARGQLVVSRTTVKTWADTWLQETQRTVTPNAHITDRAAVGWIVATIGHRRLDQLTPANVREVRDTVTGSGNSTSTALRYHGVLIRMLKAAVAEGYNVPSRVLATKGPTKATHDRQAIPTNQAIAMLGVASHLPHGSRWVAAFLQGMRQGECLGLTWPQIGDDTLTLSWQLQPLPYNIPRDRTSGFRVPDGYEARQLEGRLHLVRPKSRAGWRVLPLVPFLADALTVWRDMCPPSPHGLVWPALDGSPADENDDRDEWRALQGTANVGHPAGRYYDLHEARHATATLLMELGVPESVRIAIMGHSTMASTSAYEHADVAMARDALAQVAGRLQLGT